MPRKKIILASRTDNFALECPQTEQEHYPERTGICPRLERYCRLLGQPRRPEILPRWLRGRRGASVVRPDAAINRTEDLKCQRLRRNHLRVITEHLLDRADPGGQAEALE